MATGSSEDLKKLFEQLQVRSRSNPLRRQSDAPSLSASGASESTATNPLPMAATVSSAVGSSLTPRNRSGEGRSNFNRLNSGMEALMDASDFLKMESEQFNSDLHLPQVVVVGDQSDGKSTLLEAISGVQLPKGNGICTRCPIRVCIRSSRAVSATIQCGFTKKELLSLAELETELSAVQKSLAGDSISSEPIDVKVKGPGLPNLTVVDLPGINRESSEREEATIALIESFISKEETIIVVVVKATNDIAASKGYQMAQKADKDGKRTILVMTNCDGSLTNREEEISKILREKGGLLVPVRCFRETASNASREELLDSEVQFFKEHPIFKHHEIVGTSGVTESLESMLNQKLQPRRYYILARIKNIKRELNQELEELKSGEASLTRSLDTCVYQIRKEFQELVTGSHRFQPNSLFGECRKVWKDFAASVIEIADVLKKNLNERISSESQCQLGRENDRLANNFPIMERIIKTMVKDIEPKVDEVISKMQEIVSSALDSVLKDQLKEFKQLNCVPEIQEILSSGIDEQKAKFEEDARVRCKEILRMQEIVFMNSPLTDEEIKTKFNKWPNDVDPSSFQEAEGAYNSLLSQFGLTGAGNADAGASMKLGDLLQKLGIPWFMAQAFLKCIQSENDAASGGTTEPRDSHKWDDGHRLICLLTVYIDIVRDRIVDAVPMAAIHFYNHKLSDSICELVPNLPADKLREILDHPNRKQELEKLEERFRQCSGIADRLMKIE